MSAPISIQCAHIGVAAFTSSVATLISREDREGAKMREGDVSQDQPNDLKSKYA
jgi:hypothetical protein